MRTVVLIILFTLTLDASATNANCFYKHVKDAIKMNRHRKALYSELTDGKSKWISNKLLGFEYVSAAAAKLIDLSARKYQKAGIPLMCLDFIDMEETPKFSSEKVFPQVSYSSLQQLDISNTKLALYKALNSSDFYKIETLTDEKLETLNTSLSYNCLTRHFLESIKRAAGLAPHYIDAAHAKGLHSPAKIIKDNILLQIGSLRFAQRLDRDAARFQEDGIPIICQDLPYIPSPTNKELNFAF